MRIFFYKLDVACALSVIARRKPGYTVLHSRQKKVVKLSVSVTLCLSQFFCLSLTLFSLRLLPPLSLSLSLSLLLSLSVYLSVTIAFRGWKK